MAILQETCGGIICRKRHKSEKLLKMSGSHKIVMKSVHSMCITNTPIIKQNKNDHMDVKTELLNSIISETNITHEDLNNASIILKKRFIGIDKQIDQIINAIKPWLFFRETLAKPVIINLWGLTGCGKTKVIDSLLEILKLKYFTHRVNGSELNNQHGSIFNSFNLAYYRENDHPIFIMDEFQNYKCKDNKGDEIKDYNSIIWDFIDTGIVQGSDKSEGYGEYNKGFNALIRVLKTLYYLENKTFKGGNFTLTEEEFKRIKAVCDYDDKSKDVDVSKVIYTSEDGKNIIANISEQTLLDIYGCFDQIKSNKPETHGMFKLKDSFYVNTQKLLELYNVNFSIDLKYDLKNKNIDYFEELFNIINYKLLLSNRNTSLDFSKSLIFVIGNLDEAFSVHGEFNPDISADEFYKLTKKVNIVNIKEALLKRFKGEHIGRLGNTHIIYPSLTSASYKKIIENILNEYSEQIKTAYKIDLTYHKSIYTILYKENVFPTLGVRSLQSGMNDMIKATFSNIMLYMEENHIEPSKIEMSYKNKKIIASFYKEKEKIGNSFHPVILRLENLRENKKDEQQAMVAIHETGHAIIELLLFNKLPISIYSVTADTSSNGFMLSGMGEDDIMNRETLSKLIMLNLGGRAAEMLVFGNDLVTTGALHDLLSANELLFSAYRKYGFRNSFLIRKVVPSDDDSAKEYMNDDIQTRAEHEINELMTHTLTMLTNNKELLLKTGEYLSEHSSISRKKFLEFIKKYSNIDVNTIQGEDDKMLYGYKSRLKEMVKKLNT
jgi:cell division protease FtsH